ncbi:MAG: S4 domain-containing protein [Flavobacteriales bacterium]|nr:S4 domain-containing protein [Flavobacteriales bacterium]
MFPTRSRATQACLGGRIKLNGRPAKPSNLVIPGDCIQIQHKNEQAQYRILCLPKNRVSASDVPQVMMPTQPPSKGPDDAMTKHHKSARTRGRPTKKDRRSWEDFSDSLLEQ